MKFAYLILVISEPDPSRALVHSMKYVRCFIASQSGGIVPGFKYRVSEMFTYGDVSLSNIIRFLCCISFEACQILLGITQCDIVFSESNF